MKEHTIAIVGGGIAGLSTAIALQRIGITAQVYEASGQLSPVGAGLGLGVNALKALQTLDLEQDVTKAGKPMLSFSILEPSGRTITNSKFDTGNGKTNIAIHRADLHAILLSKLDRGTIHTGKRLSNFEMLKSGYRLSFEDQSIVDSQYLIVADGVHSRIRQKLVPNSAPRYAGYTCWRGVADETDTSNLQPSETWGKQGRFGIVPLSGNRVYWFACVNARFSNPTFKNFGIADLLAQFKSYHKPIPEIIQQTPPSKLIHNDITDLKPINQYAFDGIVLIGDAAHATTPNMAQGACMAIEDAVVLAKCLDSTKDFQNAIENFEKKRIKRTHWIVNTSWDIGKVAQLESGFLTKMRNAAFRMIPESANQRQLKKLENIEF